MDEKERLEEEIKTLREVLIYKERDDGRYGFDIIYIVEFKIRIDKEYRYWIDKNIEELEKHIDRLESDLNSIEKDEVWFGNDGGE
jgi:hypothetical protein